MCALYVKYALDQFTNFVMSFLWQKHVPLPPIQNNLLLIPAHELAAQIRNQQVKSEDVVQAYIERIILVNPILNAVVDERFELALKEARDVDKLIDSGLKTIDQIAKETPLLGVPITIKEHIAVKGLHWTAGLVARKDVIADNNALVVKLVKEAGAIVLGVTNTPELCCDWGNCVNCVYGRTLNPYDNRRITGGSSGGEGSILAAAGSVIGIGSDFVGSIRFPAMFNGIFGHKPTWDICSNEDLYPRLNEYLSKYLTTGPMCRYAGDLKLMMKIMPGENIKYLKLDEEVSLQKLNFFYVEEISKEPNIHPVDSEIKDAHKRVMEYLEEKLQVKVKKICLKSFNYSFQMVCTLIWNRISGSTMTQLLTADDIPVNLRTEFLKWMFNQSSHTFCFLSILLMEKVLPTVGESHMNYLQKKCVNFREELQKMLGENGVLLYPTHPTTATYHSGSFTQFNNMVYSAIFSVLGLPATHCPLGLSSAGLPLGIQVVSTLYNDHLCLAVAEELEKGFGGWVNPSK